MDNNAIVVDFIKNTTWEDLPQGIINKLRLTVLDAVGAAISGSMAEISKISVDFASKAFNQNEATAFVFGDKLTAAGAAFVNANAANAFDSDDDNTMVKGHIGAQLIPTAIAVAEKYNKTGKDLLTAIAIGYEVAFRVGACWHLHHKVWRAGGSWGSVANAAVAARLMGLDENQILHALGVAEYHAPLIPIERDLAHPAMVKHGMGWGAMNGILSAELAALGYTGVPSILGFEEFRHIVADIGKNYLFEPVLGYKEFLGCAYAHLPRYCIKKIRQKDRFQVEEIEKVLIETFKTAVMLPSKVPTTTEDSQFNITWPVACELVYEEFSPLHQMEESFKDDKIIQMNKRIEAVEIEKYTDLYNQLDNDISKGSFTSKVRIFLKNKVELSATRSQQSFGLKLTDNQLKNKFKWLTEFVFSGEKTEKILKKTMILEEVNDLQEYISLLV
jgi:2-methylcitrate dehydratase PrpD